MTTTTVLDQAEQRVPEATAQTQATCTEIIEAMREEIGRPHYTQAKEQLPKLERAITDTYRPFMARVAGIQAQTKAPLSTEVLGWFREMSTLCETVPNTIRNGIEGWDRLTPPIWMDGRSVDVNARAKLVHDIRFCLMNWDGVASRLDSLKSQVERVITESNWPAAPPPLR